MKFLFSAALLVVLNFCLAFSKPLEKRASNEFYLYTIVDHKAMITGLKDKSLRNLNIPQYFVLDGERYYVEGFARNAFANSNVETVNISSDIEIIKFEPYAFYNCKKLKTFNLNSQKVIVNNIFTFYNANVDLVIKGKSVPAFVESYCKSFLKYYGLPINKDYNNLTQYEKKNDLFILAKRLHDYVTFDGNRDQGNAAVALAIRHASWGGISRAYYNLAIAMGIKDTEVLIGGDYNVSAWNYVKVDDKWYNVDVSRFDFKTYKNYSNVFFYSKRTFSAFLNKEQPQGKYNNQPSKWVVVNDLIHYDYDSSLAVTYFDEYLSSNGLGVRA